MWVLESNGDYLQGRRMWLRPGKKYLFGRVKKDGVRVAIDHKTVSRKQFTIAVDDVQDGDVGRAHARTKITITDENSKSGTHVDGHLLKDDSKVIKESTASIRPGSASHELLITWEPLVLSFKYTKKEMKAGALRTKQDRLKELDIKAVSEYIPMVTTHLVAGKRNTAEGLQALIQGKPIVSDSYVESLILAATPASLDEDEGLCPMEIDLDDALPDPAQHLPPVANEKTTKPDDAYKSNASRGTIFENFVFVFLSQKQHDILLPPITTGHGKALLYKPDRVNVDKAVDYMRETAGGRKFGSEAVKQKRGAVIMVSIEGDEKDGEWQKTLLSGVAAILKQQPAEQGAFLDAILANDPYQLCRPYEPPTTNGDRDQHVAPVPEVQASPAPESNPSQAEESEVNPRPRKRPRFAPPPKKPKVDFDDDFDADAVAPYEDDDEPTPQKPTQAMTNGTSQANISEDEDVRSPSQPAQTQPGHNNGIDSLLTGTAAMDEIMGPRNKPIKSALKTSVSKPAIKPPKEAKLMDVRQELRAKREAEAAAQHRDAELDSDTENADRLQPKYPAKIVTFDLPVRDRASGTNGYKGEEWKPEWNGRKNFKKFVRARDKLNNNGNGTAMVTQTQMKLIVPLAPVPRSSYGIGDQYWEKSQADKDREAREKERERRRRNAASQARSQSTSQRSNGATTANEHNEDDESDDDASHLSSTTTRLQQEAVAITHEDIDVTALRRTRADDSQTQDHASPRKRQASTTPAGRGSSNGTTINGKRQKTLPVKPGRRAAIVHGSDSEGANANGNGSDSDDMKFTFGRGRARRGQTRS